jgi:integrase/recombinase XerD
MINELVYKLKIYLVEEGKSPKTAESYVGDTSVFVTFLKDKEVDFNGEKR